jgi:SpoVK/Ycf46/Vps4 family AAA+-type ATPase
MTSNPAADTSGFMSALSSKLSHLNSGNTAPNTFYKSITPTESIASETGSALTRPLVQSFLATKLFITNNRTQVLSLLGKLLGLSISAATAYFLTKWLLKSLDPTNEDKLVAMRRAERILKQLGISNVELNEYELLIASNIVMPEHIDVSWQDIGGLEHLIDDLRETVIYPLKDFETYYNISSSSVNNVVNKRSRLIQPPKGVLLFGVTIQLFFM